MKKNILLITVDQMRGDCLSALGHPVIETPNLDNLVRNGVLFSNAYTATPSCTPARAAIFTGMNQRNHGRVGYQDKVPWNYEHTLPSELAKAGYHTQCVGKMHVYPTRSLCGFHNVVLHDGYTHYNRNRTTIPTMETFDSCDDYLPWLKQQAGFDKDMIDLGLNSNASTMAQPWHLPQWLHPTNWVVTESIDFLRRRDPNKPFFLWMSFVRPHPPLDPPQSFLDLYLQQDLPDPPVGEWADEEDVNRDGLDPVTRKGKVHPAMARQARAAYYALITHIDHQIGRFINAMHEYGVKNNTLVLFTSDHGDMMGDHHLYRKGLPYEGSAKIPFIMSDSSGEMGFHEGSTVGRTIEMRDIMPTLLDAAGVECPNSVDGESLLPLCRGEQVPWRDYIHGEHAYGELSNQYVTDGKEKYIWFSQSGEEQLFDLRHDPQEMHNLACNPTSQDRLIFWRNKLIEELEGREEGYTDGKQLIVGRRPQTCLQHLLASVQP